MDITLMKTQGWSQELIDSLNALKNIIDKGAVKEPPLKSRGAYIIEHFSSTSINISHYFPVGQTYISLISEKE